MAAHQMLPREAQESEPPRVPAARPQLPPAEAVLPYLQRIDEARWYSNFGPLLTEFEARLAARFPAATEVVTVANATQGLTLALMAMDLPLGGYVVMPAWTFVATAHAVMQAGLRPWFVDVDPQTWMLDPATVKALGPDLRERIAAVVPVCAFGALGDLAGWHAFREETGVPVLVDAAAAFDALCDAKLPTVVSLHATKVLGVGEGGFLATDDADLARRVRQLTTYGFRGTRESQIVATNAKLSEYAGAVGLAALDDWPHNRLRWLRTSQRMRAAMTSLPQVAFQPGWGLKWVTSVCCVQVPDGTAETVERMLDAQDVETRRWWGLGCQTNPAFADCRQGALNNTDRLGRSVIGLPFSIDLDNEEIGRIAAALAQCLP